MKANIDDDGIVRITSETAYEYEKLREFRDKGFKDQYYQTSSSDNLVERRLSVSIAVDDDDH